MANINTRRNRKAGIAGYGAKRKTPVNTKRFKKTPWLQDVAVKRGDAVKS